MKKSRFTEEQIAYALRLAEGGAPVVNVCPQLGSSEVTLYTWKKKYADMGGRSCASFPLEEKSARLKRIAADLTLDEQILQEVVQREL